jgi:hypothetical protein
MLGCIRSLALQHQLAMPGRQELMLAAKFFVLVANLNRSEVLSAGKDKATNQNQAAKQQKCQTHKRGDISLAVDYIVSLIQG